MLSFSLDTCPHESSLIESNRLSLCSCTWGCGTELPNTGLWLKSWFPSNSSQEGLLTLAWLGKLLCEVTRVIRFGGGGGAGRQTEGVATLREAWPSWEGEDAPQDPSVCWREREVVVICHGLISGYRVLWKHCCRCYYCCD